MLRKLIAIVLVQAACLSVAPAQAYEQESVSVIAARAQMALDDGYAATFGLQGQFLEGFNTIDRYVLEAQLARSMQRIQLTGAYVLQARQLQDGNEHRLWQQIRYRLPLANSHIDLRTRIEERYFDHDGNTGARSRTAFEWVRPLGAGLSMSLGNELVVNLNDLSGNQRRGFSQYRLLSGLSRELNAGGEVELVYQLRYLHFPGPNRLQHQVQLRFMHRL